MERQVTRLASLCICVVITHTYTRHYAQAKCRSDPVSIFSNTMKFRINVCYTQTSIWNLIEKTVFSLCKNSRRILHMEVMAVRCESIREHTNILCRHSVGESYGTHKHSLWTSCRIVIWNT